MSMPVSGGAATSDLGGGFVLTHLQHGESAVHAAPLTGAGVTAMMSTQSVNARNADETLEWVRSAGLATDALTAVAQVHGADIARASPGASSGTADGLLTDDAALVLSVKIADCAPIWIADRASSRFALLHAGWRGVSSHIATNAVASMRAAGSDPANLVAAVGPHLQSCCFEVGPEVAERFSRWPRSVKPADDLRAPRIRNDSFAIDLGIAIAAQLREAGVTEDAVFVASACTRCSPIGFHSYRRNGAGGPLMIAVAARRP